MEEYIQLYHGTTYNRYKCIYKQEYIDYTTSRISHYPKDGHAKTREGHVHLTDNPLAALEFASICWTNDCKTAGPRCLCVFYLCLPRSHVECDPDEAKWNATTIPAKSFRTKQCQGVPIDTKNGKIGFFKFTSKQACDEFIDNGCSIKWSTYDSIRWNGDAKLY